MNTDIITYEVQVKNTIPTIRIKCCIDSTQSGYHGYKVSHHLDIDRSGTNRKQNHTCKYCGQERKLIWCNKECGVVLVDKNDSIKSRIDAFHKLKTGYTIKTHTDCYSVEKTSVLTGNYFGTIHSNKNSDFVLDFIRKKTELLEEVV